MKLVLVELVICILFGTAIFFEQGVAGGNAISDGEYSLIASGTCNAFNITGEELACNINRLVVTIKGGKCELHGDVEQPVVNGVKRKNFSFHYGRVKLQKKFGHYYAKTVEDGAESELKIIQSSSGLIVRFSRRFEDSNGVTQKVGFTASPKLAISRK